MAVQTVVTVTWDTRQIIWWGWLRSTILCILTQVSNCYARCTVHVFVLQLVNLGCTYSNGSNNNNFLNNIALLTRNRLHSQNSQQCVCFLNTEIAFVTIHKVVSKKILPIYSLNLFEFWHNFTSIKHSVKLCWECPEDLGISNNLVKFNSIFNSKHFIHHYLGQYVLLMYKFWGIQKLTGHYSHEFFHLWKCCTSANISLNRSISFHHILPWVPSFTLIVALFVWLFLLLLPLFIGVQKLLFQADDRGVLLRAMEKPEAAKLETLRTGTWWK